jgi:hypothetical protein
MRYDKKILASLAAAGISMGGLAFGVAGAGASVGNSKATVTVGSKTYKLSGGACLVTANHIDLGIGSTKNSLGMNAKIKGGKFTNAQIGMVLSGTPLAITTDSGSANAKGGTFKGSDVISHSTVKGTFTC